MSQEHARESIARFQESSASGTVLSYAFERSAFDELLAQPDAHGIRVHYALEAGGARTLVLYGTDSLYRDLKRMPMGRARSKPSRPSRVPWRPRSSSKSMSSSAMAMPADTLPERFRR
ncbi:hypothetical protein [Hyalangium versicolor]|uniref:hypothetical protein n=1 Tax=Hyalangium versicolor TaxID=2861190 RepID=UPI001CC93B82|nr:hypothetical protein [Hyalangium versicolor]